MFQLLSSWPWSTPWICRDGGGGHPEFEVRSEIRTDGWVGCSRRRVCKALNQCRPQRLWSCSQESRTVPKPLHIWDQNQVRIVKGQWLCDVGSYHANQETLALGSTCPFLGTEGNQSGQEVSIRGWSEMPLSACHTSPLWVPLCRPSVGIHTVLLSQWRAKPHRQPWWTFSKTFHVFNYNTLFLTIFHVRFPQKGLNPRV